MIMSRLEQFTLPVARDRRQQWLHVGMHISTGPSLRMGRVDPHLAPGHSQQFVDGLPMPVFIQTLPLQEAAIGKGGIGEQETAAEHKIKASVWKRQVRQGGGNIIIWMIFLILPKFLKGLDLGFYVGTMIEITAKYPISSDLACHGMDVLQGAMLQEAWRERIVRIHGSGLGSEAAEDSAEGARATRAIQNAKAGKGRGKQRQDLEQLLPGPAEQQHVVKLQDAVGNRPWSNQHSIRIASVSNSWNFSSPCAAGPICQRRSRWDSVDGICGEGVPFSLSRLGLHPPHLIPGLGSRP